MRMIHAARTPNGILHRTYRTDKRLGKRPISFSEAGSPKNAPSHPREAHEFVFSTPLVRTGMTLKYHATRHMHSR